MDEIQARVQKSVNSMVDTIDKECLRKMQYDMYMCSAKCCQNKDSNLEQVQGCIENCSSKINKAQTYVQNELQSLQDRLQRCAMGCQDQIKDRVGTNPTDADINKHRAELEKCVVGCADKHIALVPSIIKRIKETLNQS